MITNIIRLFLATFSLTIVLSTHAQRPNRMNANHANGCDGIEFLKLDLSRASSIDTTFCNRWVEAEQEWVPGTIVVNTYDDIGRLTESITSFMLTLPNHIPQYFATPILIILMIL